MEIINKYHPKIKKSRREQLAYYFKIMDKKTIFFSGAAVKKFALVPGLYIQFQNDEKNWYFFTNGVKEGFKLLANHGRCSSVIRNESLVEFILESSKCAVGEKYIIRVTGAKLAGNHILEIDFRNPVVVNESIKLKKAS